MELESLPEYSVEAVDEVNDTSEEVKLAQQPTLDVTDKNVFRHASTHPIVLDMLMFKKFGIDWLLWEGESIESALEQAGGISNVNLGKLRACATLHLVSTFWSNWEVFLPCCMAFNGVPPDFEVMQVPTVEQCMFAVDVANRIREAKWSMEVTSFLRSVLTHDSVCVPVEPLDFVDMSHVAKDYPVDVANVRSRWPGVMSSLKAPEGDSAEDEALRKMLDLHHHMDDARRALRSQLKAVFNA